MNLNRELNERFEYLIKLMRALHHGCGQNTRGYAQERALRAVAAQEGIAQRELMEQLDVRPSSMSELLTKLENGGLIERRAHPSDRRQIQLYLSREGRARAALLNDDTPLPDPFACLSDDEKLQYLNLTNRMIDALTRACEERGIPAGHPPFHRGGHDSRRDRHPDGFHGDFKRGPRGGRDHRNSGFHRADEDVDAETRPSCALHSALRGERDHDKRQETPEDCGNPGEYDAKRKSGKEHPENSHQSADMPSGICDGCGKGCRLTSPGCGHGAHLARERGIHPKG